MIEFHCPHCDKLLKTPDDKAGVRANCPGCGQTVTVPVEAQSPDVFDNPAALEETSPAEKSSPVSSAPSRSGSTAHGETTSCPMCGEQIQAAAQRCRYCGEDVRPSRSHGGSVTPHRGVLVLILGILGWVCCFPFGIAAWVMANADLGEMDAGRMDNDGRGLTIAGKVLGIVQCCLVALGLLIYGVMFLIALLAGQL